MQEGFAEGVARVDEFVFSLEQLQLRYVLPSNDLQYVSIVRLYSFCRSV
jgi:hypothetical protein